MPLWYRTGMFSLSITCICSTDRASSRQTSGFYSLINGLLYSSPSISSSLLTRDTHMQKTSSLNCRTLIFFMLLDRSFSGPAYLNSFTDLWSVLFGFGLLEITIQRTRTWMILGGPLWTITTSNTSKTAISPSKINTALLYTGLTGS